MISEYKKQEQKDFKTRYDWVGKVIHRELCKRLKIYQTTKMCIHKLECVQENETRKIFWDFRIALLYPWYVSYIAEFNTQQYKISRRYQVPFLKSLVWRNLGLNPGLPGR